MTSSGDIRLRIASAGDIPVIRELAGRIWREHYPGIITHAQIDYMLTRMYASGVIRDEIECRGFRYALARAGSEPVGFMASVHEPETSAVKISKLYLLPSFHGRGIGQLMLGKIREDALRSGARSMYLFVNKNNVKAIAAYERFGFVKAGALVTDIGSGFVMDDYRMELPL